MFKNLLSRSKRAWPLIVGTAALTGALSVATIGVGGSNDASSPSTELAAATRNADTAANRGSARTPETTSTTIPVTTTTTVAPTTTEPPTTIAPTTTTVAPATTTTTAVPKPTTTTTAAPVAASSDNSQTGGASYYSQPWVDKGCAHKTLPKGTVVTVTNLSSGKSATCVVNDRGPYISGRIIDLDTTIFKELASTSQGVFQARITW